MIFQTGKLSIKISYPLVTIMTAVIVLDTSMSVLICFITIILHESGHLLALYHYKSFPEKITLTLFDIAIIDKNRYSRNNKQELVIILAGVTVNFISGIIFYILFMCFEQNFLYNLFFSSFTLGIFNILPVDTLDGGQALFLLLSQKFSLYKSTVILDIISFIILLPVACLGFMVLFQSKYNFTLLLTALYLIAIILLKQKNIKNY